MAFWELISDMRLSWEERSSMTCSMSLKRCFRRSLCTVSTSVGAGTAGGHH